MYHVHTCDVMYVHLSTCDVMRTSVSTFRPTRRGLAADEEPASNPGLLFRLPAGGVARPQTDDVTTTCADEGRTDTLQLRTAGVVGVHVLRG